MPGPRINAGYFRLPIPTNTSDSREPLGAAPAQGVPSDISRFGPEYLQHAINAMRTHARDLTTIDENYDRRPPGLVRDQLHNMALHDLSRARNREQQTLNFVMDQHNRGEAPNIRVTSADVQTLRTLNDEFTAAVATISARLSNDARNVTGPTGGPPSASVVPNHGDNGNGTHAVGSSDAPNVVLQTNQPSSFQSGSTVGSQPVTSPAPFHAAAPYAYVVNSPTGIYGLLVESTGTQWASRGSIPASRSASRNLHMPSIRPIRRVNSHLNMLSTPLRSRQHSAENQNVPHAASNDAPHEIRNPPPQANLADEIEHAIAQVQEGQAQAPGHAAQPGPQDNQPEDLVNALAPLFRHLWLFIRLAGFIWFFTGGTLNLRTCILISIAAGFVAAQLGIFGNRLDRLQRHFEGLIGPPVDAQQGRAGGAGGGAGLVAAAGAGPEQEEQNRGAAGGAPEPQAIAERLLRERAQQDRGWLLNRAVGVERALALFIASLFPGVGERHVAERERMRLEAEADQAAREQRPAQTPAAANPQAPATAETAVAPATETVPGETSGLSHAVPSASNETSNKDMPDAGGQTDMCNEVQGSSSAVEISNGSITARKPASSEDTE